MISSPVLKKLGLSFGIILWSFTFVLSHFDLTWTAEASTQYRGISTQHRKAGEPEQKRLAVVIGNGSYENAPLKNPANDARAMAELLRKLDFEVVLREDADRRTMVETINGFGHRLRQFDVGLFYYAGHGIQVKGRNYLIPVGSILDTESDVQFESVDLGRILGKMADSGNQLNIVILDACRDNPFARSWRNTSKGLAIVEAPRGTFLAFATAPGSVAADGDGENGLYTEHLLKNIDKPGLSIEEVFKYVRIGVVDATEGTQTPWESSSLMGWFSFHRGDGRRISETRLPADETEGPQSDPKPVSQGLKLSSKSAEPADDEKPVPEKETKKEATATASKKQRTQSVKTQPQVQAKVDTRSTKPSINPEISRYMQMLTSDNAAKKRKAAKIVYRSHHKNRLLLNVVEKELLEEYNIKSNDKLHVDAMAWFCRVLGRSGEKRFLPTLRQVAQQSANRKLKKYAAKSMRYIK